MVDVVAKQENYIEIYWCLVDVEIDVAFQKAVDSYGQNFLESLQEKNCSTQSKYSLKIIQGTEAIYLFDKAT